jgi:hypothetical protein
MIPIHPSVSLAKTIWSATATAMKIVAGGRIKITSPRPMEVLTRAEKLDSGLQAFPVGGKLKWLPKEHAIWVLTQDESTGRVWPQGFFPAQYDPDEGRWSGKIDAGNRGHIRIYAVVAPPTSQNFFEYYEWVGRELRGGIFEPLRQVPSECVNRGSVQAVVPKP